VPAAISVVRREMTRALDLKVPLKVDLWALRTGPER
jgi:hypothetical protein